MYTPMQNDCMHIDADRIASSRNSTYRVTSLLRPLSYDECEREFDFICHALSIVHLGHRGQILPR